MSRARREATVLSMVRTVLIPCLLMPGASLPAGASPPAETVLAFTDSGRVVHLVPREDAHELVLDGRSVPVRMANRLLVRATPALDADALQGAVTGGGSARQLARLGDSTLWLLTLDATGPGAALRALEQRPGVLGVQPDLLQIRRQAGADAADPPAGRRAAVAGAAAPPAGRPHRAARVAVIDDGFDLAHPAFAGADVLLQYDADRHVADAAPVDEVDRHGTQVAGLIVATPDAGHPGGLAPEAGLIAIRQVSTWTSDMVLAFSVARMMKADIVNASWTLAWLPEPVYALLADWRRDAQPPYLVFAAGNDGADACERNAVAAVPGAWLVGAVRPDGRPRAYSNVGPCVALQAPSRFTSPLPGRAYGPFTGTSAAAAHVSGLLAREIGRGVRPDLASVQALVQAEEAR